MRRIPGGGGRATKKLMATQAVALNQWFDDGENQRSQGPYTNPSLISSASPESSLI